MTFNLKLTHAAVLSVFAFGVGGYFALNGNQGSQSSKETKTVSLGSKASSPQQSSKVESKQKVSATSQKTDKKELSTVLPASLQNTSPPTPLDIDLNGNLIVNIKIRNLFDYYLSAIGEETKEELVARIKNELASLPPKAQSRALEILEGYLAYKVAIDNYLMTTQNLSRPSSATDSRKTIQEMEKEALRHKNQMRALRVDFMDVETSEAFYGDEDRHDDYIGRLDEIKSDDTLSVQDKLNFQEDALREMPEWFQKQELRKISQIRLKTLDKKSMSQAEYAARRIEIVGPEAAARLEALDLKRANWEARKNDYYHAKDKLEEYWGGPDAPGYEQALIQLQQDKFSETELLRLQAQRELEAARAK